MKICIFGAASNEINDDYITSVEELAETLAKNGHELVFGAGANGVMGAAARGFKRGGGRITGVIPRFFKDEAIEAIYDECDEIIFTETMRERKSAMEDLSDTFIIAPGGIGTFEEMFEILTLKQLGRHNKPIVFYNRSNYYDRLIDFMQYSSDEGFIRGKVHELYVCSEDADEIIKYIEDTNQKVYSVKELKNG